MESIQIGLYIVPQVVVLVAPMNGFRLGSGKFFFQAAVLHVHHIAMVGLLFQLGEFFFGQRVVTEKGALADIIQIARMNEGFFRERGLFLHSGKFLLLFGKCLAGLGEMLLFLVDLGGQAIQMFLRPLDFELSYAAPAIHNAMMDMVRDAFTAFEQRMVTEDKDGICYQRVSLDDVLPGEEQLRRIEAIADPYAMQPQSIMEEQESRRELYDGLKRLTQREQTYLLYRYGFTDGEEHPLIGTAIYFHLTKGRAKKTEEQAMDNLWLELPWWFV